MIRTTHNISVWLLHARVAASAHGTIAVAERVAAKLDLRGPAFTDHDIDRAIASAMVGLVLHHEPAA